MYAFRFRLRTLVTVFLLVPVSIYLSYRAISPLHRGSDFDVTFSTGPYPFTPTEKLVVEGDIEGLRALLEKDKSIVTARGAHGKTLLHWAVQTRNTAAVALLLEFGADPLAKDAFGLHAYPCKQLCSCGCSPNAKR